MRNLLNPKWIFLVNTLPIIILFSLFYGQFNIIKTLLEEDQISFWKIFGWSLAIITLLNFIYAIYLIYKKQKVSIYYGFIALIVYIIYIYLYNSYASEMLPFSIPQWMLPDDLFLYIGTFLMPTLVYALLILVINFTKKNKKYKAWKSFLMAFIIPIFWYLFSQIILPLWQPVSYKYYEHALFILAITSTLLFLFFLTRTLFILITSNSNRFKKRQLLWKIPIAIIFPLLGLAINNGILLHKFSFTEGIFGDFNSSWFYILALMNGVLICLPNLENKLYRTILFLARSILLSFTFYFFIVFLPFLPLSILAIIVYGLGFLMLTPLLLFVIHINELSKDITFLKKEYSIKTIRIASAICFLIIPFLITSSYLTDKNVLHKTLTYLYNTDYSKEYDIDKKSLQKTLQVIKKHKVKNRGFALGTQTPYLSSFFNWLVLDNLTLSEAKINTIEKVFFNQPIVSLRRDNIQNNDVTITNIQTTSTYDKSQNAWKSWVDLEITNKNQENRFAEYATSINLPVGCWISDYYLYVGDRKEMGILSEKKAAMWVFSQIRRGNRDPGILYYLTGNKVAFRVFPFAKEEVRKTGIEFLHKEPITLNIAGNSIHLGNELETLKTSYENENIAYISAIKKQQLQEIYRKPYFHFLVDTSKGKDTIITELSTKIEQLQQQKPSLFENAKISFVNSYASTRKFDTNWKQHILNQQFEGGFYLDRAIRKTLFNSFQEKTNTYPVMVIVTDSLKNAILNQDFSDFKMTFPENNYFYNLKNNGELERHSLTNSPSKIVSDSISNPFKKSVLVYAYNDNSIAYLPNNNKASIVTKTINHEYLIDDLIEKNWESALLMESMWKSQVLHPETADSNWLKLVKSSFITRVMSPVTSYLVVENEAQKVMLKNKQKQLLASNNMLDAGEETLGMSEPNSYVLIVLLILGILTIKKYF